MKLLDLITQALEVQPSSPREHAIAVLKVMRQYEIERQTGFNAELLGDEWEGELPPHVPQPGNLAKFIEDILRGKI